MSYLSLVGHYHRFAVLVDVGLLQDLGVLLRGLAGVVHGEVVHLPADPLHAGLGSLGDVGLTLRLQVRETLLGISTNQRSVLGHVPGRIDQ